MRISIFDQTNNNINIFDNNVKQVTLKVIKTESKAKLAKLVTDRSARNRVKAVTDYGTGHWYYVNYKDEGVQTKHAVIFMNETRSVAYANFRDGKGFVENKCTVVASTSGTAVWNLYPETDLNELAMTNSMSTAELTLEEALKEIARLKEENIELVAQRDAAIKEAKEARAIKARHFARAETQKNMRHNIEKAAGLNSVESTFEALDELVEKGIEIVEEIKEEIAIKEVIEESTVEQQEPVNSEVKDETITRSDLQLLKAIDPFKYSLISAKIKQGIIKVEEYYTKSI